MWSNRTSYKTLLTLDGQTLCISEWARVSGVNKERLKYRLRQGMDLREAIQRPSRIPGHGKGKAHDEKARRARVRKKLAVYKASRPCKDCGNKFHPEVMEFDHVRGEKLFQLSDAVRGKSLRDIATEIAKCDLVCANCHRIRTFSRRA